MYKIKRVVLFITVIMLFFIGTVIADKQYLRNEMIRIHVVANSNSDEDQQIKLMVKDAINSHLSRIIEPQMSCRQAYKAIVSELPKLETIAKQVLNASNCQDGVEITLTEESFPMRKYETFTLPSGVYQSLRVRIGSAEGENWWCIAFPALCDPVVSDDFLAASSELGLSDGLSRTITNQDGYEIRFFFLDILGRMENILTNILR